jgi:hypothetical protein
MQRPHPVHNSSITLITDSPLSNPIHENHIIDIHLQMPCHYGALYWEKINEVLQTIHGIPSKACENVPLGTRGADCPFPIRLR